MESITDEFGRQFKTLRVSLTSKCNLACVYCVDDDDQNTSEELMSWEKFHKNITKVHSHLKLSRIKLTGGEPLLYKDIDKLIFALSSLPDPPEVSLTTNALLLEKKARKLYDVGLRRINISLDTLEELSFQSISRRKGVVKIISAIDEAIRIGFKVKLNAVPLNGFNEKEMLDLFLFAKERKIKIRFLELMKMGCQYDHDENSFISEGDILTTIKSKYTIKPLERKPFSTASYWTTDDGYEFGFISNESNPFCGDCDRLRMDHRGYMYGCICSTSGINFNAVIPSEENYKNVYATLLEQKQMEFKGNSSMSMKYFGG